MSKKKDINEVPEKKVLEETSFASKMISKDDEITKDIDKRKKDKKEGKIGFEDDNLELSSLSFKERTKVKLEKQKAIISDMDRSSKIEYLVGYYKWYVIIGIIAIVLVYGAGNAIYRSTLPLELMVTVLNDGKNETAEEYIEKSYRDYYSIDKKALVQVFSDITIDNPDEAKINSNELTDYEKVMVYITSDQLDAIICNEVALEYYKSTGDICPIETSLDSDIKDKLKDYYVEVTDKTGYMNKGKPYAAALDISDTDFAKNLNLSYDTVYLLIPVNRYSENENTMRLIKMIYKLD